MLTALLRETVSLEYPHKFFNLLDQLSDPRLLPPASRADDVDGLENSLELATASGILEDTEALARIKMNLALSSATPKLEAFYNYYESNQGEQSTCESWVDWYGTAVCDPETLARLVDEELESNNSSAMYVLSHLV